MALVTRKPTEAEFNAYVEYVSPRQREHYSLMGEGKYAEAKVLRDEIDTYCFTNKIAIRRSGVRIIKR